MAYPVQWWNTWSFSCGTPVRAEMRLAFALKALWSLSVVSLVVREHVHHEWKQGDCHIPCSCRDGRAISIIHLVGVGPVVRLWTEGHSCPCQYSNPNRIKNIPKKNTMPTPINNITPKAGVHDHPILYPLYDKYRTPASALFQGVLLFTLRGAYRRTQCAMANTPTTATRNQIVGREYTRSARNQFRQR